MRSLILVALLAATAHAQAPGEVAPQTPGVMLDRWAVNVALGGESATAHADGASNVGFALIEVSGRFRIRADIEVALTLGGGGGNTSEGDFSTGGLYADVRYRFLAERAWNVIALVGLGVESIGFKNVGSPDNKARGSVRIGGGVERRFGHFALEADLRLFEIAENKDAIMLDELVTAGSQLARYGVSGVTLTLGGTYYF